MPTSSDSIPHRDKPLCEADRIRFLEQIIEERDRQHKDAITALEKVVNERDVLYKTMFANSAEAVKAALAAQKELNIATSMASEKAIQKAEEAQRDYNVRSNEFRGQLDDQAKTLMPRVEALGLLKNMEERLNTVAAGMDSNLKSFRDYYDKNHESLSRQVIALQTGAGTIFGKEQAMQTFNAQKNWSVGVMITVLIAIAGMIVTIAIVLLHK